MATWTREDVSYCSCTALSYIHSHCPCQQCNGKAVSRSTEYRHWQEASLTGLYIHKHCHTHAKAHVTYDCRFTSCPIANAVHSLHSGYTPLAYIFNSNAAFAMVISQFTVLRLAPKDALHLTSLAYSLTHSRARGIGSG